MQTVLCVMKNSNYYKIEGLDLWDKERDAYKYRGTGPIIAHPPCQQWSKLRSFAKYNAEEKGLGPYCIDIVQHYGGIVEHPLGSNLFKTMGIPRNKLRVVWQSWWGYKAKKPTILYAEGIELLPTPLCLDAITGKVDRMGREARNKMPLSFCEYLVNSINKR